MNYLLQKPFAIALFLITLPLYFILFIAIKTSSKGPFLFRQERIGKNRKPFLMYKFRSMVKDAEKLQKKYQKMNEADGPVFKIRNDPRYTKLGKILARTAIDELPQLINIIKGEMAFVGPRPLPKNEAEKVPKKYGSRFAVLPGLTSPWVVKGTHNLTFDEWMKSDCEYSKKRNTQSDIVLITATVLLLLKSDFTLMFETVKQILKLLFKSNKIYLIPILLLLVIIALVIISASISPVPIFMYPII